MKPRPEWVKPVLPWPGSWEDAYRKRVPLFNLAVALVALFFVVGGAAFVAGDNGVAILLLNFTVASRRCSPWVT